MNAWGLQFANDLVQISARILPGEIVTLGENIKKVIFMDVIRLQVCSIYFKQISRIIVILVYFINIVK